jgi:predicted ATPase
VALVTARLGLPADGLPASVADLVWQRAGGNPFFAQELVFSLRDQGLIQILPPRGEGADAEARCVIGPDFERAAETLPNTLHGLILARIDRLLPEAQLTLKVASVIGRVFAYRTLRCTLEQYATLGDSELKRQLDDLAPHLTPLYSPLPDLTYSFKHVITQEVAYQTLLFSQRRAIHRTVAQVLEALYPTRTDEMAGLLAHHWAQADEPEKAAGYLLRAGI